jgi:DNA ligase (NAD+)
MDINTAQKRLSNLISEINKYDYAYYNNAESLISDFDYDKLFNELIEIEKQFPELVFAASPTQRVAGEPLKNFATIVHSIPMLSLANTYNEKDVRNFDSRVKIGLEDEKYEYCVEMKFDGVSMSLIYKNKEFAQAITRGNGAQGDDVTNNIKTMRNIPLRVNSVIINGIELTDFEVRGEVYITDRDFIKINEKRIDENEKQFANSRNLTAGTIKLLDPKEVAKRPIRMVCYYFFSSQIKLLSQSENIKILKQLGFPISAVYSVCNDIDAVINFINEWHLKRFSLGFQTDGIVIKLNDLRQQDYLGTVGRNPRWAIAYKYAPETAETRLNGITLQVGRTGAITPVAELAPVFLAGTTISRATLHNADFISELDLHIGDTVSIEKGGDIIPKVTQVIINNRPENSIKFEFPHYCNCELHSPIIKIEGEANHYCEHPSCPWQIRKKIEHFASRNAMDIAGLGEKVVDKFVSLGFLKNIADIYDLHKYSQKLKLIEGYGEKSVDKLLEAIENSMVKPFYNVLYAVGIRFVGEKTAKILAKNFPSINLLLNATKEELTNIFEIGERIADSIYQFFHNENEKEIINRLIDYGLHFETEKVENVSNIFAGKTFVFTGELTTMTRTEAANKVELLGGKETKSVSKKTTYVVVGDSPGSKYDKAILLNVTILTETEFIEKIKNLI